MRQEAVPAELGCRPPHRPLEMAVSRCSQPFAASPCSKNVKLVYRLAQDPCSFAATGPGP